ncbi:hypothetical protein C6N75_15715 [Streptomyces solincola]|uniref:Uncharacterized protein n=1 Tax=Streptomyces solincola TaxID=2100817 RepID=A0A2S9PV30_9ACTN|nr:MULTISPECIES: hypothetical protein [Streptomyces]PRH78286.1 hypothetical protein C6N75_15715 [Streptomyces solincola]
MRITHLRRATLTALPALAALLIGIAQPAAAAGPAAAGPDLTFSVDQPTATPGSTVNLTMTFTNNQATDVWFVYQSVQPTWPTTQRPDLKYAFSSCTAQGVTCSGTGGTSLGVNYAVPVPPGAQRTVDLAVTVAPDSGCNGTIGFYSYLYYEYDNGQSVKDGVFTTPETRVVCAPAPDGS